MLRRLPSPTKRMNAQTKRTTRKKKPILMILISCIRRSYIRQGKSPFWTYDLSRYTWELICPFCIHQTTHHLPWKNHPSRLHQLKYNAHSVEAMVRKGEQEPMWRFLNLYQLYYTPIVYHPGSPCSWINTCIWCYLSWFGFEISGWMNIRFQTPI